MPLNKRGTKYLMGLILVNEKMKLLQDTLKKFPTKNDAICFTISSSKYIKWLVTQQTSIKISGVNYPWNLTRIGFSVEIIRIEEYMHICMRPNKKHCEWLRKHIDDWDGWTYLYIKCRELLSQCPHLDIENR